MSAKPPRYRLLGLGDILTPEQLAHVTRIANQTPPEELTAKLKEYFATIAPQLEAKGVVPGYFAYLITAIVESHQ